MQQILGVIFSCADSPYASMPLLGKPCRAHVEEFLREAGVSALFDSVDACAAGPDDLVVFASDDIPHLEDLDALLALAIDQPTAIITRNRLPQAVALRWSAMPQTDAPITSLDDLLKYLGDAMETIPPSCPQGLSRLNSAESYAQAYGCIRSRILRRHMQNGVILLDPDRTIIEADVKIGAGTILYPDNTLQGSTSIGERCTLYPGSRMLNATIGDETTVEHSVLLNCSVGSHTTVGPFAYLRPQAAVGSHCRIGDFVEIKNSNIGDGTKVSHLTYVGDGDLGKNINLGCGVVFSNYDGKLKHRTIVEDNAFIGCNVNLVPPVHIGKDTYIAAGSTVTQDVPDDALFIARVRGEIKEGWVSHRREKGKL